MTGSRFTRAALLSAALFGLVLTGCDSADLTGVTADGRGNDKNNRGGSQTPATSAFDSDASDGVVDLIAGQHTKVGTVSWTNNADGSVEVTFQTLAGYCMTEWHLDAGTVSGSGTNKDDFAGIKVTGGGAVPGQMDLKDEDLDPCLTTVTRTLDADLFIGGGERIIAAHAVVVDDADGSCNYFYGIASDGNIYEIRLGDLMTPGDETETLFFDTGLEQPLAATLNWPNSIAYNPIADRLYYSNATALDPPTGEEEEDTTAPLYFYDFGDNTGDNFSGNLTRRSASGTFIDDTFYYVPQNVRDNLRAVTFNADGTVASRTLACGNFTGHGSDTPLIFGDLVYNADENLIYGSAAEVTNPQPFETGPPTFFSINPESCDYVAIAETDALMQLTYDCDGNLIGFDTGNQRYLLVDPTDGSTQDLGGSDIRINDLAPGKCDCPPDFDETAWGLGPEFPGANWSTYIRVDDKDD